MLHSSFSLILLSILEIVAFAYFYLLKQGRVLCFYQVGVLKSDEEMFMASLICRMDADCEKLLICKMDLECVKALQFDAEVTDGFQNNAGIFQKFDLNYSATDASRTYLMGKSPFLALDQFIESVASIGNVSGKIWSWCWFSEYGLMVYSMSRSRYCERIGREHKSNKVIYVIDLRRGDYYQKCHDPDCRGYRSPLRPIPDDVLPDSTISFNLAGENEVQGPLALSRDENITDSCSKQEWWLEAVRVADQLENMRKALDMNEDETCEEDDEWWKTVEMTASQTELTYFGQS